MNKTTFKHIAKYSSFLLALVSSGSIYAAEEGYATRYWDGCKPHCSWYLNADGNPMKTCDINNDTNSFDTAETYTSSSCDGGDAYTCWDMSPFEVSDTLSYGFAAVPADDVNCGTCYELTFTGEGKYNEDDTGSAALKSQNKSMIVMATNIGYDVSGGQFDILIPGGGVGAFNACSTQWGVSSDALGAQYGGFLTSCQSQYGYDDSDTLKSCVQNYCDTVFAADGMEDLKDGCEWFIDWYEIADNPVIEYEEVTCPDALVEIAYDLESTDSSNNEDSNEEPSDTTTEETEESTSSQSCDVSYNVTNQWNSGYVGEVTVSNNTGGSISSWDVTLTYSDGSTISSSWNAEVSGSNGSYTASNISWNGSLSNGSSTSFGITVSMGSSSLVTPSLSASCQ